ncbi:NAD-dependent epimerase/dehydratase family protein [Flagellimonas hymeniacidonis]|uniref:NAD-dependent epimerase/dehydratase family protein n=1 Tax=Flagellimonas hymeniacidonis TaxID=2603628 RepID=A0A5C8V309_9FLAO|nr:NAD-dependent epimerase/dehydratase family protein [Flagellimonas hymeniacidonis]TXN34867.1 NAD-dependent epimerase/dehydratase family protein [Flagellimonas hymeniacidonis]
MKRRSFLEKVALSGALVGIAPTISCTNSKGKLKILVLGGTNFLGPAIVNSCVANGHAVTLFNRGITNPDLFSGILPQIKGDREDGKNCYEPLQETHWDVVFDVWPQRAKLVEEATEALKSFAKHYVFVSSVAVYKDFNEAGRNEDDSVLTLPKDKSTWSYPEEKIASENFVVKRFPKNHTILRPGPIKGWRDPAHDLLYWILKLQRDQNVLAPGSGTDPLQFIDVKDVGRFATTALENKLFGVYNCVGPTKETLNWKNFLETAKSHLNSKSNLFWSSRKFLETHQVYPWDSLPLWAPTSDDYFMEVSNAKAVAAGFSYTPIEKTLDDCLAWCNRQGEIDMVFGTGNDPIGITHEKELEVISGIVKEAQTNE